MPTRTDHVPVPLTQAELARRLGMSRPGVLKRVRGPWARAKLVDGRVDAAAPDVIAYARGKGVSRADLLAPLALTAEPAEPPREPDDDDEPPADAPETPDGGLPTKADFLRLSFRKRRAEALRLESRFERDESRLVARQLVHQHVTGLLDGLHRQLLESTSQTLALRLLAAARAGETPEGCVELARSLLGRDLGFVRARATRSLRYCTTGDSPPEPEEVEPADPTAPRLRAFAETLRGAFAKLTPTLAGTSDQGVVGAMLEATVAAGLRQHLEGSPDAHE